MPSSAYAAPAAARSAFPRRRSPSRGFDWGAAAIGAGGLLGLMLVALGGVAIVNRRRPLAG
jgi:hypothetical protein